MKKLLNPRGYLSHTQIDMWRHSKERYIRQYIHGEEGFRGNKQTEYGSKFAKAEETGEDTDDEITNMVISMLPKYPKHEHTIRVTFKTPNGEVDLLGKLDKFDDRTLSFRDTKTGTTKWTQAKANKHPQLKQYASLIYLKHAKMPKEAHLDWVQTEVTHEGEIQPTGQIQSFAVHITLSQVLEYLAMVSRVAVEIDETYRAEMTKLT